MAEEIREERDEILEDIEASLAEVAPGYRSGYRMTIEPNGILISVTTTSL